MQGLFINHQRPTSKKQVKEAAAIDPSSITIEATSFFGNEYDGDALSAPDGETIYFVGPDPSTKRNFYGQLVRKGSKLTIT